MAISNITYIPTELGLDVVILKDGSAWVTDVSYIKTFYFDRQFIASRCKNFEIVDYLDDLKFKDLDLIRTPECLLVSSKIFGSWLIKDHPTLAIELVEFGATIYLYKLAGFNTLANIKKFEIGSQLINLKELKDTLIDLKDTLNLSREIGIGFKKQPLFNNLKDIFNQITIDISSSYQVSHIKLDRTFEDSIYGEFISNYLEVTNDKKDYISKLDLNQLINKYNSTKTEPTEILGVGARSMVTFKDELVDLFQWKYKLINDRKYINGKKSTIYIGIKPLS